MAVVMRRLSRLQTTGGLLEFLPGTGRPGGAKAPPRHRSLRSDACEKILDKPEVRVLLERDWDTAEGHLRKSRDLAVSLGNPVQQWKTEIALGHLLKDAGRTREAQHAFQRAFGVMQQVRQTLREERLRVAFEKNSDLRLVQDLLAGMAP